MISADLFVRTTVDWKSVIYLISMILKTIEHVYIQKIRCSNRWELLIDRKLQVCLLFVDGGFSMIKSDAIFKGILVHTGGCPKISNQVKC